VTCSRGFVISAREAALRPSPRTRVVANFDLVARYQRSGRRAGCGPDDSDYNAGHKRAWRANNIGRPLSEGAKLSSHRMRLPKVTVFTHYSNSSRA